MGLPFGQRLLAAFTRPVDALPLDIFRVAVGLVVLAYFIRTFSEAPDFSGPDGLLDHALIAEMYWFTRIGIFQPWMGLEVYQAAFLIACACCIPLILGYRVKLFALILYVIAISTYRRNFLVMYVDDCIVHLLLFWMLLLPVGRTIVVREWLTNKTVAWEKWKTATVSGAALRCFFWNLALLYLVAGLWKWTSPMWLDGTALYVIFKLPISYFQDFWGPQHIPVLRIFDYGTLVLEPLVPLMFILKRGSRLKYILAAAFLALHLLSVATLNIPYANVACAATVILIFGDELMAFIRRREIPERVVTTPELRIGFSGWVAIFMVSLLTFAMISSVSLANWRTATRELAKQNTLASDRLTVGRNEGLGPLQLTFFGTLWTMGIAQQYQLFNWIDDRNYATRYAVILRDEHKQPVEADPDKMFLRSLRGVLLDFYIHDITWIRVPPENREELRRSILTRTAGRYCRNERPASDVTVYSSIERIDPHGGLGDLDGDLLMKFHCNEDYLPVFAVGP